VSYNGDFEKIYQLQTKPAFCLICNFEYVLFCKQNFLVLLWDFDALYFSSLQNITKGKLFYETGCGRKIIFQKENYSQKNKSIGNQNKVQCKYGNIFYLNINLASSKYIFFKLKHLINCVIFYCSGQSLKSPKILEEFIKTLKTYYILKSKNLVINVLSWVEVDNKNCLKSPNCVR
jgi:hypothetical protein